MIFFYSVVESTFPKFEDYEFTKNKLHHKCFHENSPSLVDIYSIGQL